MSWTDADQHAHAARGVVIAAPRSGSGKTVITLGLIAALRARGHAVAAAKTGPDYIDKSILYRAAPAINLDPWAMSAARLRTLAATHAGTGLLVVEGVMGLFDAAADATGSTADLAQTLDLPVILVVDATGQSQSIAALVHGYSTYRPGLSIAGVILNRVASPRHESLLRQALTPLRIPVLGAIPRDAGLHLPERHLGLVLPDEVDAFPAMLAHAAAIAMDHVDVHRLVEIAAPLPSPRESSSRLAPLGQRMAIASDRAFAFVYDHLLADWRAAGAELRFFSPLADEAPSPDADAVFLPGGYPELHAATLAAATRFKSGLAAAAARGALIYGECGGYMVLGDGLTAADGTRHAMAGLLPVSTDFSRPRRRLGYRRLSQSGALPWPRHVLGHEFHYSGEDAAPTGPPLFAATTADGEPLPPMGCVVGRVMGSYAHVIDAALAADA